MVLTYNEVKLKLCYVFIYITQACQLSESTTFDKTADPLVIWKTKNPWLIYPYPVCKNT